jgi:4-amino-4-deoxychorismate lyase
MSEWRRIDHRLDIIPPDERGFQYGDGLFETVAIRGGKARLWSYHARRLETSCRKLGLEQPVDGLLDIYLEAALRDTSENSNCCIAKIIVTAGVAGRGYARRMPSPAQTYVGIFPATPPNKPAYQKGVATILCKTRLAVGSPLAGLKTLNRLEQVLARSEVAPTGAFEGLTLDAEGRVICGTMSNVFIVRGNQVMTPSLRGCGVAGIMRELVLEELRKQENPATTCDLDLDDLKAADEVFITNSQMGAVPIHRCGDMRWSVGPVTRDVMGLLAARGIEECRL